MRRIFLAGVLVFMCVGRTWAGPYASTGIAASDPAIVGWATGVINLTRGPQDISNPSSPLASFGTASNALGKADGTFGVVSLGDGGSITLSFARPIVNGPGADFSVFENGFASGGGVFGELGAVAVSADGKNFVTFPSISKTQTATQAGPFSVLDPTNIHNLAGQFPALQGTPFDLSEVGLASVNYVRITDVVGSIDPKFGTKDSEGNFINDPFPTPFASSGFDADAVGVLHQTPEPSSMALLGMAVVGMGGSWIRRRRKIA